MTGGELRALREGARLTQVEAAGALKMTYSRYATYERGEKPIEDELAGRAARVLGGIRKPTVQDDLTTEGELRLALGEATMMLGPDQRAELTRVVGNALVDDAVARAVMARVGSTLADEVARKDAELRAAKDELARVRAVVSEGRR